MLAYALSRLLQSLLVLLVVGLVGFGLTTLGDPITGVLGTEASAEARAHLRAELRLDDPFVLRYARYMLGVARGDFGISFAAARPVVDVIGERLPPTVELGIVATLLSLALGIPLGVYTALHRDGRLAQLLLAGSLIGVSLPPFVLSILLILLFAVTLGWLPSFGRGATVSIGGWPTGLLTASGLKALIMPAIALAVPQSTLVMRLVRAEMLDVLRADFIRFAHARGLTARAVNLRHAVANTVLPVITITGLQVGYLLSFAVVAEFVFQWPGMGLLFIQALQQTDIPVIAAFLPLTGLFFVVVNLVIDLLYLAIDPRLRTERGAGVAGGG